MQGQECTVITGALTVDAMEALFQPVPFGEVRESVLEKISTPDNAPIWDMFRSIDPDKQQKVLIVRIIFTSCSHLVHADQHSQSLLPPYELPTKKSLL